MDASSSVQTWLPGLSVGQYTLVRELARGGMGEIWLARQSGAAGFERLVVLKRVIGGHEDASFVNMFLDEARIASHLHHPNVVQVFELGQQAESYYLVMEYLTGQTVSRLARRSFELAEPLSARHAVEIIAQAAKGLGYAHRRKDLEGRPLNIVHRDVSPQNLFITYDGQVKVLDFGIARAAGRLVKTSTGVVKGKMAYMSPEQAMSESITGAADVFSLGVILFELVTGTRLYPNGDEMAVLRSLVSQARPPRPSERTRVEKDLDQLIVRMLDPYPAQRFADGQSAFEALDAWLSRQPAEPSRATLEQVMHARFEKEMGSLEEFHRLAVRTPTEGSMPDQTPLARVSPTRRAIVPVVLVLSLVGAAAGALAWSARASSVPAPVLPVPIPQPTLVVAAPVDAGGPETPAREPDATDAGLAVTAVAPVDAGTRVEPVAVKPAVVATGTLTLQTEPWTRVMLGKRKLGDTPLINARLPVGTHRLKLINEDEKINSEIEVTITAGNETVKKLAF